LLDFLLFYGSEGKRRQKHGRAQIQKAEIEYYIEIIDPNAVLPLKKKWW
jgi:hypothetical protein